MRAAANFKTNHSVTVAPSVSENYTLDERIIGHLISSASAAPHVAVSIAWSTLCKLSPDHQALFLT
jgi:hypothetical protein